jgi:hypothetical protein
LLGLIVLAAVLVVWQWWRNRRRRRALAPQVWAEAELARLARTLPRHHDDLAKFYVELADLVRRYVSLQFRIQTLEQTTTELVQGLRQAESLAAEHQNFLSDFFAQADLVKFARVRPTLAEAEERLAGVRRFVQAAATPSSPSRV